MFFITVIITIVLCCPDSYSLVVSPSIGDDDSNGSCSSWEIRQAIIRLNSPVYIENCRRVLLGRKIAARNKMTPTNIELFAYVVHAP
jgi:hypothetical protein